MKKLLGFICIIALICSCSALAEDALPEITFNGIPLGATAAEVETLKGEALSLSEAAPYFWFTTKGIAENAYGLGMNMDEPFADQLILMAADNQNTNIAGYDANVLLFFVRPNNDGVITQENGESVFYTALCHINNSDAKKAEKDINKYMTEIYGKAANEDGISVWYGANNTAIMLNLINSSHVALTYVYFEGDTINVSRRTESAFWKMTLEFPRFTTGIHTLFGTAAIGCSPVNLLNQLV